MPIVEIRVPADSAEGTTMEVGAWLRQVGESVRRLDPIVEMETDKVTVEIEAPEDGILEAFHVAEGDQVEPGQLIATLRSGAPESPAPDHAAPAGRRVEPEGAAAGPGAVATAPPPGDLALSPAVKRFVKQHSIDVTTVTGTGRDDRITLRDVEDHHAAASAPAPARPAPKPTAAEVPSGRDGSRLVPHTGMRRAIAQHLSDSLAQAPHVTSVFELDFSAIIAHRRKHKAAFAERGVSLSYTAYFIYASARALEAVPQINSRWHDDAVELFGDINIGVGTALDDDGLVVPVIRGAHTMNLFGIAQSLQDLTTRARDHALTAADTRGGTFTISNHGVSGSLIATPIIINQPQSAILGIGALEKRVVVREVDGRDSIAVRPMAYVSLTIDHRVVDGYQTNTWLSEFTSVLHNWEAP
ncbi:MAG: dihydrolipoamide acetyltransferase family protein [Actinomycetota bacterium]